MNILDAVILIVFCIFIYLGYAKGVVVSLMKLVSMLIALIGTYFYHPFVKSTLIEMTKIDERISETIVKRLMGLGAQNAQAAVSGSDLNALTKLPLPQSIKDDAVNYLTTKATEQVTNVSSALTDMVMSFLAMLVLFVLIWLVVRIISSVLNTTAKLPVLSTLKHAGGAVLGGFVAYIGNSVGFLAVMTLSTLKSLSFIEGQLATSFLAKYFFEYNIFVMIGKFFS